MNDWAGDLLNLRRLPVATLIEMAVKSEAVLTRSTWHPLGFIHSELWREGNVSVRFHLWHPHDRRPKQPEWPIHNHVFRLESRVLVGCLKNRTFSVKNVEADGGSVLYAVEYSNRDSTLVKTATAVSCSLVGESLFAVGDSYVVESGSFHESLVPMGQAAATIVIAEKVSDEQPLVVGASDGFERYRYERLEVDADEMRGFVMNLGRA